MIVDNQESSEPKFMSWKPKCWDKNLAHSQTGWHFWKWNNLIQKITDFGHFQLSKTTRWTTEQGPNERNKTVWSSEWHRAVLTFCLEVPINPFGRKINSTTTTTSVSMPVFAKKLICCNQNMCHFSKKKICLSIQRHGEKTKNGATSHVFVISDFEMNTAAALCCSSKRTVTHRTLSYMNFSTGLVHPPPWFVLFHCRNQLMFVTERC